MKIFKSESFIKTAYADYNEGPNKVDPSSLDGTFGPTSNRGTEGDQKIIDRWSKPDKKKPKKKKIYQLGIDVEESAEEIAEESRTY